jgi:hypothetical protein
MSWTSRGWILIGLLLTVMTATGLAQLPTTQVADTIYHADGTVATGTVLINWPAFTTSTGESIASGSTSATIGAGGALSVQLTANSGSIPMGSYYTAIFHLDDGSVSREYWVVPVSTSPVRISAIESTVLPTSVAMQAVTKSYVDTAIAAALVSPLDSSPYVLKAGDTMTGPLQLPADPVSALQAADKSYVDESIAALSSGLGQKVSTLPTATQIVSQPTGTQLDVNNLNDIEYASQYVSGLGGNGIVNAVSSPDCTGGCEVKVEQDYLNETFGIGGVNNQTHVTDARGGRRVDSYSNPVDVVGHGASVAQSIDDVSTQSEASLLQQTGNAGPAAIALAITQEGLAGGSNQFPQGIETTPPYFKMGYSALSINGVYNTQGQHGLVPEEIDCFGVGDCLMGSRVIHASGGVRDSADEGAHLYDTIIQEDLRVFTGTCLTGCTSGSTSVMLAQNTAPGTQGDGRFLIDTNPAKTITSASTGGAIIGGGVGPQQAIALFGGTNFPVSVFLTTAAAIPSQANNIAPGTVTFAIATTGVPSGYASNTAAIGSSNGLACIVDADGGDAAIDYEMAPYTVVDATHLQMTLNKAHHAMATLAFGGLCGYGLEQTIDTSGGIRQVFPVVGSYSPTALYYASGATAVVGAMNQTDGFVNMSTPLASLTRSGGVVTVIATGGFAVDINGLAVTIAGVADSSFNGTYVVTTTGSSTLTYTQSGANSSSIGGTVSLLTGGFALYPMAEVLSVFDTATRGVDGQMTLAPNNVPWAVNDTVEQPHYYQEFVVPDVEFVGQTVPRPTSLVRGGIQYQQNNTEGLIGWSIANASPQTNYLGYGGTHTIPDEAYDAEGIWRRTMSFPAGEQAVFAIHCNFHGCSNWNSGFDIFQLDNPAGFDTVHYNPPTHGMTYNLGSASYSFTPLGFTAGTINVGSLNATTINGSLHGAIDAAVIGGTTPGPVTATQLNGLPVAEYTNAPRKPLMTWMQALHNAANQPARVLLPGDSFGICGIYNCTDGVVNQSNLWSEQLRINLQSQYGSHGTGVVPAVLIIGSNTLNNAAWSITGSYSVVGTLGPTIPSVNGTLVHLSSGATITFNDSREIPFDHFSIYYATPTSTSSLALVADGSISIGTATSGSAAATGAATGGLTAHRFDSSSMSLATHTITSACTGDCYVWAGDGTAGTAGVSVDNVSIGSCPAECFGLAPTAQLAFTDLIPGGNQGVIVMQQTNEPGQGYSPSSFSSTMSAIIAHEQALSTTAPASVMLAVPPVGSIASSSMASFTAVQTALAQTLNVAFVNTQDRWGTAYASTSGLWDFSSSCPGCHPNDKGSRDEYSQIWASFVDPVPFDGKGGGAAITLTTIGTTGPATLIGGVLNIPNYTAACPSNFCVSLSPNTLTYVPGLAATQTIPITVTQTNVAGYGSTVTYSATGVPSGMAATASPTTITGGSGTTTVTASFPWNQASGSNAFTVSGTDGTNTHTQSESLTIGTENNNLAQGWAMNEGSGSTAASTPTGDNLTLTNVTWGTISGFPGSIAQFNGSSSYATAANATNTNFSGSTAFSAACWLKPTSLTPADQYFITNADTGVTGAFWGMEIQGVAAGAPANGSAHVHFYDGTSTIDIVSTGAVVGTSAPSLVGFTYDGSRNVSGLTAYVNGAPVSTTATGTSFSGSLAAGNPIVLGTLIPAAGNFGGALGYCRLASRAYTTSEWSAMYAAGPQ